MIKSKFEFGDKVKDIVTGFKGIVMARSEYATGCIQFGIQSCELKDNLPIRYVWIDVQQLELVKKNAITIPTKPPAGPMQTPPAR